MYVSGQPYICYVFGKPYNCNSMLVQAVRGTHISSRHTHLLAGNGTHTLLAHTGWLVLHPVSNNLMLKCFLRSKRHLRRTIYIGLASGQNRINIHTPYLTVFFCDSPSQSTVHTPYTCGYGQPYEYIQCASYRIICAMMSLLKHRVCPC
jgi:hypothetical protein